MSDFPTNLHEMKRMGYTKSGIGKCKGCGADLEWWTTTKGQSIPMNPMPVQGTNDHAPSVAHFSTCPKAGDFRKSSAQRKQSQLEPFSDIAARTPMPAFAADPRGPDAGQVREAMPLERDLRMILRKSNARVVMAIHEGGTVFFYRMGIPAEELRQDIITAANQVRDSVKQNEVQR